MLTPADIDTKQFGTTRLKEGYDQNEVDSFLDRVVRDYGMVLAERDNYQADCAVLRLKLASLSEASTTVIPTVPPAASAERILVAAQRTADDVESEANAEAGRIRAVARAEAENVKAVAETERQRILNQLEGERAELEERIEALKAKRSNYKSWLRAALNKLEDEEINDA